MIRNGEFRKPLEIFSTSPQSRHVDRSVYTERVIEVARWSEDFGCTGILVYTDNNLVDPWLVSHAIVQHTESLCPLVAVQPVYLHPYAAAKMVSSLGHLHGRRIYLNMLAGGFKNDLVALGDTTPHDDRYVRTTEYTLIIKQLLEDAGPVTFDGRYYQVKNLRMTPSLPRELFPGFLISGSSMAGMEAAEAIGATAVKYPKPSDEEEGVSDSGIPRGIRVGIIARESSDEAWSVARARFPEDRRGQVTHQLAMKTSDSSWHRQLSTMSGEHATYWLEPFRNYHTFCPYLVGSYDVTAGEIARYIGKGYRTFILDIPPSREELDHTRIVFDTACREVSE
jgi:alkanesulfonate monooxygenase